MKAIITFALTFFIVLGFFIVMDHHFLINEENYDKKASDVEQNQVNNEYEENKPKKEETMIEEDLHIEEIHQWIGKSTSDVTKILGKPERTDLTQFGYEWMIYRDSTKNLQIGVNDGNVVTVYSNHHAMPLLHVSIGMSYEEVDAFYEFNNKVSLNGNGALRTYDFELSEEEIHMRPLVYIGDGVWAQFYFDIYDNVLSGIRYTDQETLLLHRPYSIVYRGSLPEVEELSNEDWKQVQDAQARQIFDLTNDIRKKHGLTPLEWDDATSNVALGHSKDMHQHGYFSHTSPNYGELTDRLESESIAFRLAAENIAAKYVDAIEAVEGWLNSEGHRINLLHEDFTHIGIGVYRDYYTQNFLTPR
ncbi:MULTISPECIES: CAP domain-containing protein [Bacillaceae]|nr:MULTISPECIES: CAP domain-containing protein [Bacillaceae]